jgi:undecaprenyl-diphosphatase
MSVFEAIAHGIVYGFSTFLPVSAAAHQILLAYFTGWSIPDSSSLFALHLGMSFSLLVYFRHDWASLVSSFLRVLLFWQKPMMLDERLPFFLSLTSLPILIVWFFLKDQITLTQISPLWIAASLVVFSIPLVFAERWNRKSKKMVDWNVVDGTILGFFQILALMPGVGRQAILLSGALIRNYRQEAAMKYAFLSLGPILFVQTYFCWKGSPLFLPFMGVDEGFHIENWLAFGVALLVAFGTGLLAIGGLHKTLRFRGLGGYTAYRLSLALAVVIFYWVKID